MGITPDWNTMKQNKIVFFFLPFFFILYTSTLPQGSLCLAYKYGIILKLTLKCQFSVFISTKRKQNTNDRSFQGDDIGGFYYVFLVNILYSFAADKNRF
jgi:hypothetical protein